MNFNDWSEEIAKNFKQADDIVKQILGTVTSDDRFTQDSDGLKRVVESMVEEKLKLFGIPSKRAHDELLEQFQEAQRENEMLWKRIKILEDKLAAQGKTATPEPDEFKPAAKRVSKPAAIKKVTKSSGVAKPISKTGGGVKPSSAKQTPTKASTSAQKATAKKKPSATSKRDDLSKIKGIGPKLEEKLVAAGIKTYAQLAALTAKEAVALDDQLGLQGRVLRDDWIKQAATLTSLS